jgi:translation initiation factor IF-1
VSISKPKFKRRRRQIVETTKDENFVYFDEAEVVETLPGVTFKVKVKRELDKDKELAPIFIVCGLKPLLIKRRVSIIRGDRVRVVVNPIDMYFDEEKGILKGTIFERK